MTGLGTPVANLLVPDLIAYQGTSPTNATASAGSGSGTGQGSTNAFNAFNVFDAVRGGSGGIGDLPTAVMGAPATAGAAPGAPHAASRNVPLPQGQDAPAPLLAETLFRGYSQGYTGSADGTAPPLAPANGPLFQAPAAPAATWSPVLIESSSASGPLAAPVGTWLRPEMPVDGSDDLLVGGAGDDLLIGNEGGDLLLGGYAGNGAPAASRQDGLTTAAAPRGISPPWTRSWPGDGGPGTGLPSATKAAPRRCPTLRSVTITSSFRTTAGTQPKPGPTT